MIREALNWFNKNSYMQKIFLFCTLLIVSFSPAQSDSKKIKKLKSFSVSNTMSSKICTDIMTILPEYNCKEYRNKKYHYSNDGEELMILYKKNKIKLSYASDTDTGVLGRKFDELTKRFNE